MFACSAAGGAGDYKRVMVYVCESDVMGRAFVFLERGMVKHLQGVRDAGIRQW